MNEPLEGTGVVEEKSENKTKKGDLYWRFKIDGQTFGLFEYKAGESVKVGDRVYYVYTESQGQGAHGPITYRNLKSIGPEVSTEEVKGVGIAKEVSGVVPQPASDDRRQKLIVRQSSLNYATQLASIYYTWFLNENKESKLMMSDMQQKIKEYAKDYEDWINRE